MMGEMRLLRVLPQKYICNGCTVCCTVMGAAELAKPFYAQCEHKVDKGCGIYDNRPQNCKDFVCSWAAGFLGEGDSWRPDHCGLLFFLRRFSDGLWIEIYESAPGAAADAKRVDYLVQRLSSRVVKVEPIMGTRLHHFEDRIGLGYTADDAKYPGAAAVSDKQNRYDWVNGDKTRHVFRECHE